MRHVLVLLPPWVVYSPGGKTANLWWGGGSPEAEYGFYERHRQHIADVQVLEHQQRLAILGFHGIGAIWDPWETGDPMVACGFHGWELGFVRDMRVFPDGKRVAVLGSERGVVIWSASTGELLQHLRFEGVCDQQHVVRVLDDSRLATGVSYTVADPAVVWDAFGGKMLRSLQWRGGRVISMEASPCGAKLATAVDTGVHLWDTHTGRLEHMLPRIDDEGAGGLAATRLALTTRAELLVSTGWDRVLVWDGSSGKLLRTLDMPGEVMEVVSLPNRDHLLVFSVEDAALWDLRSGSRLLTLEDGYLDGGVGGFALSAAHGVAAACTARVMAFGEEWDTYEDYDLEDHELSIEVTTRVWSLASGDLLFEREDAGLPYEHRTRCSVAVGWHMGSLLD